MKKALLALLVVVALFVSALAAFALQGPEETWGLQSDHAPNYCGFSHSVVNAGNPTPGSQLVFGYAQTIVKTNPSSCWLVPVSNVSSQQFPAGSLKVTGSLRCRWAGGPETQVWTQTKSNTVNTGEVHVQNAGDTNPCQDPDHLGLEERVVTTTWFNNAPGGAVSFLTTTHWVTP